MRFMPLRRGRLMAALLAVLAAAGPCPAIEMFTFFGDGSRIGLPSLEVPIEAYPGIPLRSDRLRARRRAQRAGPGAAVGVGPGTPLGGITIRSMPEVEPPAPPAVRPAPAARARVPARSEPAARRSPVSPAARSHAPIAPEPPAAPAKKAAADDTAAPIAPEPEMLLPPRSPRRVTVQPPLAEPR